MAGEGTSSDAPAQVEVKEPKVIEKIESETLSHTDSRSEEQTSKVDGKPKADEVGTNGNPVPEVGGVKADKIIEDENGAADIHVPKMEEIIPEKKTEDEAGVAQVSDSIAEESLADNNGDAYVHNIEETIAQKKSENESSSTDIPVPKAEESIKDKKIEDEVDCGDAAVPKTEGAIVGEKAGDENVQPVDTIGKPESDSQGEIQREGTEVTSTQEIGSENVVAEEVQESTESIREKPTEPHEGTQPGGELIVGMEQEKSREAFAEDKAKENGVTTESSSDVKPEIKESKVPAADVAGVPKADDPILESQESRVESPSTGEVSTEGRGEDSQLEVAAVEVPEDNKVQESELIPAICASTIDQPVGNYSDAPAVEESSIVAVETEKEQPALKEEVSVEKAPDALEVRDPPALGTEAPPSETEAEQKESHIPLAPELKVEPEKKVDDGSTNNHDLQAAMTKEVSGNLPEKVSDLPKKDEVVKEVIDSIATSDIIAIEPKEQVVQMKVYETVVSTDQAGQLPEPAVEAARKTGSEVEKEGEPIIENTSQNLVSEPMVKTTLHDLMQVDNGSEVIEELVKEPTAESSAVIEQSHGTNPAAVVEIANDSKKPEPETGDSRDLVQETTRDYVPPSLGLATDGGEPNIKGTSQETSAADPEKEVATETVRVEESTEVAAEEKETAEVVEKVDKEAVDREEETTEANVLNSDETTKNVVEETGKQEVTIKSVPRQSNNIMLKVKQSIVKVKKAITGKSPSSKSSSSKATEKAKQ